MADIDARARIRGCLLGGAAGDALGAPVEFLSRSAIIAAYGPRGIDDLAPAYGRLGAITDDTQMTLFTAEGLLRAYVRWCGRGIVSLPDMMQRAYRRWLRTQDLLPAGAVADESGWLVTHRDLHARRAPGRTCVTALQESGAGTRARNHSKGCGGVMRVAPIGLFRGAGGDPERAFDTACEAAAVTHGHVTGQLAAGAMAAIIARLMQGETLVDAAGATLASLRSRDQHHETSGRLEEAIGLSRASAITCFDAITRLGAGWVAEEALAIGLYCALRETSFEQALILAVNHDGDSDSTGSIAGQLLGALLGEAAVPAHWRHALELADLIVQMADDLHDAAFLDLGSEAEAAREFRRRYPGA